MVGRVEQMIDPDTDAVHLLPTCATSWSRLVVRGQADAAPDRPYWAALRPPSPAGYSIRGTAPEDRHPVSRAGPLPAETPPWAPVPRSGTGSGGPRVQRPPEHAGQRPVHGGTVPKHLTPKGV